MQHLTITIDLKNGKLTITTCPTDDAEGQGPTLGETLLDAFGSKASGKAPTITVQPTISNPSLAAELRDELLRRRTDEKPAPHE
ncbi:MAG TPA: hypothetical protein PLJ35_15805 [Anaerolineae bacterium]|nr:hypothetical protein [Anaerolineae bacterium]HOR00276.1 hypothetical protein [Anaerolineae bacterium]